MNNSVRAALLATARARRLITYTELAAIADLDLKGEQAITQLGHLLDEIAMDDVRRKRPLLAAVVVRADTQMPSKGLFKFAKSHGLMRGNDEMGFWSFELKRVYESVEKVDGDPE